MKRFAFTAAVVMMLALALSSTLWWALASPAASGLIPSALLRFFAIPVGVVGWLMGRGTPDKLSALVGPCDFCTPREHFVHFLEAAVPAYAILLGALGALLTLRKRRSTSD